MKLVVGLGGNALLKRGEPMTEATQRLNVRAAAIALVRLIHDGHKLVITHGNGPQVGLIALQAAAGPADGRYPLDILGAESQGMIGYLIEQELRNLLPKNTRLATILSQVRVDAADEAFLHPTKPIGPIYNESDAHTLELENGWTCIPEGAHWRRVVASPEPLEILEFAAISALSDADMIVICTGGGGVPVVVDAQGEFSGIEAVIDKDRASALLASQLDADMLLLLTDVDSVYERHGRPDARSIVRMGPDPELAEPLDQGSMGPKVEAATRFALATGRNAGIGLIADATAIVLGKAGTIVQSGDVGTEYRQ